MKRNFYDGLIKDLLDKKAYQLAQVIYSEKKREKFDVTLQDHIVGFEIFGAQSNIDEYKEIFSEVIKDGSDYKIDQNLCEEVARTMLYFKADSDQRDVLEMTDTMKELIFDRQIRLSSKLLERIVM